jgi:hypothetical protein
MSALVNLTCLDNNGFEMEALPHHFFSRLTTLRVLSIMYTSYEPPLPSIQWLTNLEEVRLQGLVENIGSAFSNPWPSIRRMYICAVPGVPDINWSGLAGLTELTFDSRNGQFQLHPSIGCLSRLQRLALSGQSQPSIPLQAEIGRLTSLTELLLYGQIFRLSEAISGLVRLRKLVCHGDSDWNMRQTTIQLPTSLTELRTHSPISNLPASLSTVLSRLRNLECALSDSVLDTVPALRNMPSLRHVTVNIRGSTDKRVGEMLAHATGLTYLDVDKLLHWSDVALVMAALPTLTSLGELHLGVDDADGEPNPPGLKVPSSIVNLSELSCLQLAERHFRERQTPFEIPPWVFQLTSLQMLNIDDSGRSKAAPARLSAAVSNLVSLRVLMLPWQVMLCNDVSRLTRLTRVHTLTAGDDKHQEALEAVRARSGVQFTSRPYLS